MPHKNKLRTFLDAGCPSGCSDNQWSCNLDCYINCSNPDGSQNWNNVTSMVLVQTMGVFLLTAGTTYAYMMYTDTLGVFTLLTPVIFGAVSCGLFLLFLCAEDEPDCIKFVVDWTFCTMKNMIEEVISLIPFIGGLVKPTWDCDPTS